jgi:crotonobetainyl-CoA:carnitine CoA-transferase CaiB-like acyl-CoA transferase
MIVKTQHAVIEDLKGLGTPLKMKDTPTSVRYPPPRLGEHTQEVLREYLDQASIDQLLEKKIIA